MSFACLFVQSEVRLVGGGGGGGVARIKPVSQPKYGTDRGNTRASSAMMMMSGVMMAMNKMPKLLEMKPLIQPKSGPGAGSGESIGHKCL